MKDGLRETRTSETVATPPVFGEDGIPRPGVVGVHSRVVIRGHNRDRQPLQINPQLDRSGIGHLHCNQTSFSLVSTHLSETYNFYHYGKRYVEVSRDS